MAIFSGKMAIFFDCSILTGKILNVNEIAVSCE